MANFFRLRRDVLQAIACIAGNKTDRKILLIPGGEQQIIRWCLKILIMSMNYNLIELEILQQTRGQYEKRLNIEGKQEGVDYDSRTSEPIPYYNEAYYDISSAIDAVRKEEAAYQDRLSELMGMSIDLVRDMIKSSFDQIPFTQ